MRMKNVQGVNWRSADVAIIHTYDGGMVGWDVQTVMEILD